MSSFQGTALIVGAAGEIGSNVTKKLIQRGCTQLALADLDETALDNLHSDILEAKKDGQDLKVKVIHADVRKEEDVHRMIRTAVVEFGAIHYCANCVGIAPSAAISTEASTQDFMDLCATNQRGTWTVMKAQIQQILTQPRHPFSPISERASIVNVAAADALAAQPQLASFAAVNHAIRGMTRSTAADYIHTGVRFNTVCPGATESRFLDGSSERSRSALTACLPTGRPIDPEEVAEAVVFLLSPLASAINGVSLPVDAGWSLYHH